MSLRGFENARGSPDRGLAEDAGLVVGPIIWILGIVAALALLVGQGSADFGAAITSDRISETLTAQASLIRSKIFECWLVTQGRPSAGWPTTPASGLASDLLCPGDPAGSQSLWTGARPAMFPAAVTGFSSWQYAYSPSGSIAGCGPAGNSGGICIWTQPLIQSNASNPAFVSGVAAASGKFSPAEGNVDPSTLRFTLWIRRN